MPENDTLMDSSTEQQTVDETTQESVNEVSQPEPKVAPSPEEVEFNSLSGSTQDRIRSLIKERNESREQLTRQAQVDYATVPTPSPSYDESDEVLKAARLLKEKANFVSRDEVTQEVNQILSRIETDRIHQTLEREYDGSDGSPKYDRLEVEDYARRKNIWDLRAAFRDMYFDEFQDAGRSRKNRRVITEKPRASTPQEPITLESIQSQLRGSKRMEFYEKMAKNPAEMDRLLQELTQGE